MSDLIESEKAARQWSEDAYRKFVVKAVSDRWLRIMVTCAVFGLTALGGALAWFGKNYVDGIAAGLTRKVPEQIAAMEKKIDDRLEGIDRDVARRLSSIPSEIVEKVEEEVSKQVTESVSNQTIIGETTRDLLDKHLSAEGAGTQKINGLVDDRTNGIIRRTMDDASIVRKPFRVIALLTARDEARDRNANLRTLGVEHYAMYSSGPDDAKELRTEFIKLLGEEVKRLENGTAHAEVLEALFTHYPLESDDSPACQPLPRQCDTDHAEAVQAALGVLKTEASGGRGEWRYMNAAASLLSRITPRQVGYVTLWLDQRNPASQAQRVLEAIVSRDDPSTVVPDVVHHIATRMDIHRVAELHEAIQAFALALPPDLDIAQPTRLPLVARLWNEAPPEARAEVLSGLMEQPVQSSESGREWGRSRVERPPTTGPQPAALTRALANLLRPTQNAAAMLQGDGAALAAYRLNMSDPETAAATIHVMAWRLGRESQDPSNPDHAENLQRAADGTLGLYSEEIRTLSPSVTTVIAGLLQHGSDAAVLRLADTITGTEIPADQLGDAGWLLLSRAMLDRDRQGLGRAPYGWLSALLADSHGEGATGSGFWADAVLRSVVFPQAPPEGSDLEPEGPTVEKGLVAWFAGEAAARDPALAAVLLAEIDRRVSHEFPQYWHMVTAIEDAVAVPATSDRQASDRIELVRNRLAWLRPDHDAGGRIRADRGEDISLEAIMKAKEGGGLWGTVSLDSDSVHRIDNPTGSAVELVLFDPARTGAPRRWTIQDAPAYIDIPQGEHVLAIRQHGEVSKPPDRGSSLSLMPVNTANIPVDSFPAEILHDTGDAPGEVWLDLSLQAGQHLWVTTASAGDGAWDPDTVLYLYDADGEILARNDDYGDSWFSQIHYPAPEQMNVRIHVNQFGGGPFDPHTRFLILIDEVPPAPEEQRRAEN